MAKGLIEELLNSDILVQGVEIILKSHLFGLDVVLVQKIGIFNNVLVNELKEPLLFVFDYVQVFVIQAGSQDQVTVRTYQVQILDSE